MTTDQAKDTIRAKLRDYLPIIGAKPDRKGRDMYSCPLCGSGTHNTSTSDGAFHVTGETWHCFSCERGGDIFDLYATVNNLDIRNDFGQIVTGLADLLDVQIDQNNQRKESPVDQERRRKIIECAERLSGSSAETYLRDRGFSDEIMKKYRLGYDSEKKAVVIPYPGIAYYAERFINPYGKDKYHFIKDVQVPPFIIKEKASNNYIITEGQLDALSLAQAGAGNVIASSNKNKISELIESKKITISGALIIGDNDDPGRRKVEGLKEIFAENGIPCAEIYPPEGYKDSNDLLKADQKKLEAMILEGGAKLKAAIEAKPKEKEQAKPTLVPVNGGDYFSTKQFDKDLDYFRKYKDRKTGFSNIDKYLRLYPGLALLTGSTSLGKTTLATQLCDQLIERGETVIYFSLEQLPIEIFTKSLARGYFNRGGNNFNNRGIREGATDSRLEAVKEEFIKTADRFNVVICDFNVSGDKIVKYVKDFMKETGIKPIVVVDYLQLVSAPEGERLDDRARVDDAIKRLKTLSKENELFILAISNMARSSYREKIAEDSYKETGLAEFSADYLFGLQLAILEDKEFFTKTGSRGGEKETLKSEKQDQIDEASEAIPKEVVFKTIKNRPGQKTFKAFFKYRPDYDLFIVDDDSKYDKHSQSYKHEHSVTEYKHSPR